MTRRGVDEDKKTEHSMRMVRRQTEVICSIPGKGKSWGTSLGSVSMCSDPKKKPIEGS